MPRRRTSLLSTAPRSSRRGEGGTQFQAGESVWSQKDRDALQAQLDPLQKSFKLRPAGWTRSGEVSALICTQKSDVYERTVNFLGTLNILSGLVLSSITETALHPYQPEAEDFIGRGDAKKVLAANIFNALAAVAVSTQLLLVMYSTFYLVFLTVSSSNPSTVYRALANSGRIVAIMQFGTFLPLFLIIGMTLCAVQINASHNWCNITTFVVMALVLCTHVVIGFGFVKAFPWSMWNWAGLATPWMYLKTGFREDAERQGKLMMAEGAQGVFAGMDTDGDMTIDAERTLSAAEARLVRWIDSTLPELGGKGNTRRDLVVDYLLAQHLTLDRLRDAARLPSGFVVLMELFDFGAESRLTQGQRMALAIAAMKLPAGTRGGAVGDADASVSASAGNATRGHAEIEMQSNPMVVRHGAGASSTT